jgi:hypothetical protein
VSGMRPRLLARHTPSADVGGTEEDRRSADLEFSQPLC